MSALCLITQQFYDDQGNPAAGVQLEVVKLSPTASQAYSTRIYRSDINGLLSFNAVQGAISTVRTIGGQQFCPYPTPSTFTVPSTSTAILSDLI